MNLNFLILISNKNSKKISPKKNFGLRRNKFRTYTKLSAPYKGNKIKTTKTFQLRMQNRKTHGSIINKNIRPQSASMMIRICSQKNRRKNINIFTDKREKNI